jgi:hypothetical protein
MGKTISDFSPAKMIEINEYTEAEAERSLFLYAPPEFARPFRLEAKRIGSVYITIIPELDFYVLNRILGLGIGESLTESTLDEVIDFVQQVGCKNYMAQVCSSAQPSNIPEWLATRGFMPSTNWAKMYRGDQPAPAISTDLRLEKIGQEHADSYANVVLPAFHMSPACRPLVKGHIGKPGWHHYLGFAGEEPVSAAAMFINSEVAWVGWQCTLKSHRKRGGQSAMIARSITDGLALGCKWFIAETREDTPERPNPSYHNLLKLGFELAYMRRNYVHKEPSSRIRNLRRGLFINAYSMKFELQRLIRQRKTGK